MKPSETLIADLMQRARVVLYKGRTDKGWFTQQDTVKKALTLPAAELAKLGVTLPAARYEQIVAGILQTIGLHGDLARVRYPGAYFLHAVQEHWKHHGHEHYEEGKAIRNRVGVFMSAVDRAHKKVAADTTVPVLAQVHAALEVGKRKPKSKAASAAALQGSLLAFSATLFLLTSLQLWHQHPSFCLDRRERADTMTRDSKVLISKTLRAISA